MIKADIQICFDLSRNIDFHQQSMAYSKEKAIAGITSGLIELGESVTWEASHFGFNQRLTSKITEFNSPNYFVDEMVSGAFKSFRHEHLFEVKDEGTMMTDIFHFESPYGVLGKIVNILFLKHYMAALLSKRNLALKNHAENLSS